MKDVNKAIKQYKQKQRKLSTKERKRIAKLNKEIKNTASKYI